LVGAAGLEPATLGLEVVKTPATAAARRNCRRRASLVRPVHVL